MGGGISVEYRYNQWDGKFSMGVDVSDNGDVGSIEASESDPVILMIYERLNMMNSFAEASKGIFLINASVYGTVIGRFPASTFFVNSMSLNQNGGLIYVGEITTNRPSITVVNNVEAAFDTGNGVPDLGDKYWDYTGYLEALLIRGYTKN